MTNDLEAGEPPDDEVQALDNAIVMRSLLSSAVDGFHRQRIEIAAASEVVYDEGEWIDALVIVERGAVEVVCTDGTSASFQQGAMLVLAGLPIRVLRNLRADAAVLVRIRRAKA